MENREKQWCECTAKELIKTPHKADPFSNSEIYDIDNFLKKYKTGIHVVKSSTINIQFSICGYHRTEEYPDVRKPYVNIYKFSDSWFFIRFVNFERYKYYGEPKYYKCDEMEGIYQCLTEIIN